MVAGTMDGPSGLMLFGAGLAGGLVTAVVGGASLITFPALLAAGLPPIVANASNVIKNLLSGLTSLVAAVVFVFQGMVAWPPTLVMMGGALIGGFLGGRLARVLPPGLIRGLVVTIGTILTGIYAWRYWRP